MLKYLTLVILLGATQGSAQAAGITISQSISSSNIAFEDSVLFGIELRWVGPQSAYLFSRTLNPTIDGMVVRGFSSSISSTQSDSGEVTTKKYRYVLAPITSGLGRIDAVTIDYVTWPDSIPGQLVTEPMSVTIAVPQPPAPPRNWVWALIAGAVVVVFGAVTGVIVLRRRRNREPVTPVKTKAEQLLDGLAALKESAGSDFKAFQTGLYRLLAEFLQERCGIDVEGLSEEQLAAEMEKSDLAVEARDKITGWLARAGRDKFSPVSAGPGETIRLEAEVRALFEKL